MEVRCPACGWRFGDEAGLRRHMEAHHGAPASEPSAAHQPAGPGPEETRRAVSTSWLVISYVAAFVFPIAGLIAGIVLLVRRVIGHGAAIVLISIAIFGAGLAITLDDDDDDGRQGRIDRRVDECLNDDGLNGRELKACIARITR